jgi:cell division protein FtsZ
MGTGLASGEDRAMKAVNEALESPLLDSNDIFGTKNILLNIISGKEEITIGEIGDIIETLQEKAGQEADIIWGNGYDESLGENISVTILATGFETNPNQLLQPKKEPEKFPLEKENENGNYKEDLEYKVETESSQIDEIKLDEELEEVKESSKSFFSEKSIFPKKKNKKVRKVKKKEEPVEQSNIDNWFYKNFGLGKLFEDDQGENMDEE